MEEIWRDIETCDGYQASNMGRIRSKLRKVWVERECSASGWKHLKQHLIKPATDKRGYLYFIAYCDGQHKTMFVHRAVLFAFLGHREVTAVVNHKDGNKTNNVVGNLEFVSQQENVAHAIATGLFDSSGERHATATATESQVREAHRLLSCGIRTKDVAAQTGLTIPQVLHVLTGDRWQHLKLGPVECQWRKTVTDEHRGKVIAMRQSGMSLTAIAKSIGLGTSTVGRIVKARYALAP